MANTRMTCWAIATVALLQLSNAYIRTSVQTHRRSFSSSWKSSVALSGTAFPDSISTDLKEAFLACQSDIAKTCKVMVSPTESCGRLGLVATKAISKGDMMLEIPYDDRYVLSSSLARDTVFKNVLADEYDGWTGDSGLISLLILNEVARASSESQQGIQLPKRSTSIQAFMEAWVRSLPTPTEMKYHPLLWSEEDQEILQSSSNTKIYRTLDDIEDDASWLIENVFDKDRDTFPESVSWNDGQSVPCFSLEGYKWAMALTQSRSVFVDNSLRVIPFMDMCNHNDDGEEVRGGSMGAFGTTKGAQLVAAQNYKVGDEIFCSYGPKSAADYILEHGFSPPQCWKSAVSELSFELDPKDRFYYDKLDVLEYETYDQAPMDPVQSFDVVCAPGRDGEPDPAMIQFLRLLKLGGTDAFLLESIFRKEIWGFMSMPVSERNELDVVNAIIETCQRALNELNECPEGGPDVCKKLRESEARALTRTLEYLQREKEALDLKEYYQERRLKDLGLDSEWSPEDEILGGDAEMGYGQTRAPGGADYDW